MAELHYHANKSQPNHGAPVVRNMLFNTCPLHQRKYFWKCERCDEENKGKGKDTPVSPAPDNIGEQWDYGRCQGVKNDGFQCPYQVAAGKRKYCKIHAR